MTERGRRVFVSYTSELADYPHSGPTWVAAAVDAVVRAGGVPVHMDAFTAADALPAEVCCAKVASCQVWVGLVGFRYGSPVRDDATRSYVELEYDAATSAGMTRLVFLLPEEPSVALPRSFFTDEVYGQRQAAFRQRLDAAGLTRATPTSPEGLTALLLQALHELAEPATGISWPVVVGRPPLLADAFQRRSTLAEAIETGLAGGGTTVLTQVVAGDGGTGKTQLAVAAFEHAQAGGVDLAVWVPAASRESILASYAQAHAATSPARDGGGGDAQVAAEAFLAWLAGTDRSWLVVLDDVADPADLRRLWPRGRSGQTLVTTRRRDAAMSGHRRVVVDVGVFHPEESVAYLTDKLTTPDRRLPAGALAAAGGLAVDLGHLPVALAQAAAVIINDGITCGEYRRLFAERTRRLAELFPPDPGEDYEHTVATTWSLATDRADALPPAGLAHRMLHLVATMDPAGTPEAVFTSHAARAYLASGNGAGAGETESVRPSAELARQALRNLHLLSVLTHEPGGGGRSVRMHALAQRATLERLDPAGRVAAVRAAADALVEVWPDLERDAVLGQVFRANATAVAARDPDVLWQPDGHAVLFRSGQSLGQAGLVTQTASYFDDLAATAVRVLGPPHPHHPAQPRPMAGRGRGSGRRGHRDRRATHRLPAGAGPRPPRHPGHPAQPRPMAGRGRGSGRRGHRDRRATHRLPAGAGPRPPRHPGHPAQPRPMAGRGRGSGRRGHRDRRATHRLPAGAGPRPPRHPGHPEQPRLLAGSGRGSGRRGHRVRRAAHRPPAGAGPRPPRHPHHPWQPRPVAGRGRRPRQRRRRNRGTTRRPAPGAGPRSPSHPHHPWQPRPVAG